MAEAMLNDIADLFGEPSVARDPTGSLASILKTLPSACDPVLAFLADAEGNLLIAESVTSEDNLEGTQDLATQLHAALPENEACLQEVSWNHQSCVAFATQLSGSADHGILGIVARNPQAFQDRFKELHNPLSDWGEVAWNLFHEHKKSTILQTQLQQLLNEQHTLKVSHSRVVSQALEEHEKHMREQQESMERLKKLHLQNKMILNSAGEGILGIDSEGKISFVNPAGARMVGWQPEELVGQALHDLVHHTKRNGQPCTTEECDIHRTLLDGAIRSADNEIFWRKNKTSFPVEYTSTPIWQVDEIIGAVLTFRDTTERKMLEQQLAQAQKLESIGQLAAGIAHEINTPTQYIGDNTRFFQDALQDLNLVIEGFKQLLTAAQDNNINDELIAGIQLLLQETEVDYLTNEMADAVEQTLEGVKHVAGIVRSMKEFSHPGSDEKQTVDINRALENTLTVSRNEWKYVAEAVTNLDPHLPHVSCLPGECNQVFLNLIINASHAIADRLNGNTSQKGTITLTTYRDGNWAEIRIQDNGTGIPETARDRIMDPFYTTKEVGRGTGQGLAIAHAVIVEKHGGTLHFETETGKGTTFFVRLPIEPDPNNKEASRA